MEQRESIAFLTARKMDQDDKLKQTLVWKIDDPDESRWVELHDLKNPNA